MEKKTMIPKENMKKIEDKKCILHSSQIVETTTPQLKTSLHQGNNTPHPESNENGIIKGDVLPTKDNKRRYVPRKCIPRRCIPRRCIPRRCVP